MDWETASIARFILANTAATPYYHKMPENFMVPAVYFPAPTATASGDSTSTWALLRRWVVLFFVHETQDAIAMAQGAAEALCERRCQIPLYNEQGAQLAEIMRLDDPSSNIIDTGAANLTLTWTSRRKYPKATALPALTHEIHYNPKEAKNG
ncbi:MAG: hypothetical protein LBT21_06295 [Oscillospiraceae bacterium]|jgi:hypothetical protein|nr:hypothetical protein [Oscillospiraceae bacterium]